MGKTSKVLVNPDKERSVRNVLERCIKRKKLKKDLDDLRQQVIKKKHAMRKNQNQVKAQKTTFEKTLAEFAGRRQVIDDNTQSNENVKKPGQKKICSKLLADPFVGIFKNGARGKEVSRKQEFFNETDNARVNGDVFRLLQGDDSTVDKVAKGLRGKMAQILPEHRKISMNIKQSPVLVKSSQNKRKTGLIQGAKAEKSDKKPDLNRVLMRFDSSSTEKLEEDSDEDLSDFSLKKNQRKSRNEMAEIPRNLKLTNPDEDYKHEKVELVRRNNENCESKSSSSIDHEFLSREMCKKMCNAVSQQLAPENCFMSTERDPLKTTRLSLKCLYSDSHRQRLLRNKAECSRNGNVSTSGSVDSNETQRILNNLKEKTQHKKPTKKCLFTPQLRSDDTDDFQKNMVYVKQLTNSPTEKLKHMKNRKKICSKVQEPSAAASSSSTILISEISQKSFDSRKDKQSFGNNLLSWQDDTTRARRFPKDYEIITEEHYEKGMNGNSGQDSKYAPVIIRRSNKSLQNTFKNAFRENPQISPLNLSQTDSETKDINKSLFVGETMKLGNWIRHPKTPTKKKASHDERSHLLKSKLDFMAAKNRQTKSIVPCSSLGKFFTTGKAKGKKKHVVNFEDLFKLSTSYQFSRDCQKTVEHQNSMLQQRNSSDFKSQVRRDDQLKKQNQNTQEIHQQASKCPVIFLQSEPQSYPENVEDIKRDRNITFYENSQQPFNCLSSFYPSQLQNLTSSHMEPEKTLITRQPSDLKIRNGIGNLNLFPHTLIQPSDVYDGNRNIGQISSSSTQTHHLTSQPIKFIAIESDQQVQRRVPVYFHEKKPYIAYLPSNKHEGSCKVIQSQPRIVPCMQCANSASGTVFCHQNVSTLPPVAHQNSFRSSSQGYHIDKSGNATIPEVRFIKNNAQHGVQVLGFDDCRLAQMYMTG